MCCCKTRCNHHLPFWVQLWLLVSAVICAFDVWFTMYRPHTLAGGDLDWLTKPWRMYSDIDIRYNTTSDVVTCATGRLMIVEIVLNIIAVVLAFLPCYSLAAHSVVVAFMSSSFVFWKTLLYVTMYIMPPEGSPDYLVDDFSWQTILIFWVPDGIWILMPLLVMLRLWPKMVQSSPPKTYDYLESEYETAATIRPFH